MNKGLLILEDEGLFTKTNEYLKSFCDIYSYKDLTASIQDRVGALFVQLKYQIDPPLLKKFPQLKFVVSPTTGLNHIDLDYCEKNGIQVISLKGEGEFLSSTTATAELTWGLILSLVRQIPGAVHSATQLGVWDRNQFRGRDLSGMVLGILGYGRLGRQIKKVAEAFGMKVLVCEKEEGIQTQFGGQMEFSELGELLNKSDIVTLHIDYHEGNNKIFGKEQFESMKDGSFFINTSRGEVIDEDALLSSLEQGKLAGAAVDVLSDETQNPTGNALVNYAKTHSHLLVTPHIGGCTRDSMEKTEFFIAHKLVEHWT